MLALQALYKLGYLISLTPQSIVCPGEPVSLESGLPLLEMNGSDNFP